MSDDYLYYSATTYLGESGLTHPCTMAMAAIVTSAFRPQKITAVIGDLDEQHRHETVLFLVWNWASQGLTMIPDGFGTHRGEGGVGFSNVLGLIKFYEIPLLQVWTRKKQAFYELAEGKLTQEMFDDVQEAWDYNWNFYRVSEVRKVKRGKLQFLDIMRDDGTADFSIQLP